MTFRVLLFIQPSNSLIGRYIFTSPQTITTTFNSSNTNTTNSTNTPTGMNKFMVVTDTSSKIVNKQRFQPFWKSITGKSLSLSRSPVHLQL